MTSTMDLLPSDRLPTSATPGSLPLRGFSRVGGVVAGEATTTLGYVADVSETGQDKDQQAEDRDETTSEREAWPVFTANQSRIRI